VPALQLDDGRVLTDSMVVSEYIDNAFPENKLTPADPFVNAQHKLLIEPFSKVMVNHMKVSKNVELTTSVPLLEEGFDYFEKKLHTKFFGGMKQN
jgi:glutathione S-transferase